jgi:hypothetical protein
LIAEEAIMRRFSPIVLSTLGLVVALSISAQTGAYAQKAKSKTKLEDLAFGQGVLCNTAQQIERYLALYRNDTTPETAVQTVNTETRSPGACGFAYVAFIPGDSVGTVNVSGGVMRMMKITVLARKNERGWIQVMPTQQFTALFDEAEEA